MRTTYGVQNAAEVRLELETSGVEVGLDWTGSLSFCFTRPFDIHISRFQHLTALLMCVFFARVARGSGIYYSEHCHHDDKLHMSVITVLYHGESLMFSSTTFPSHEPIHLPPKI